MRWILHIDMDAFFAAVEQKTNPALQGKPVGVCGSGKRTVIAAASYEAKAYGVKSGMTVGEGRRLCPELILVPGCHQKYIDSSAKIIRICEDFTPLVEVYSIDEAFLDISGSQWLYGEPREIGRHLRERIRGELGLAATVGIAPNKFLAKLLTKKCKPDGLGVLRPEETPGLLENLPVEKAWGIGPRTADYLHRIGIRTLGQLGRYPEELLVRRFGVLGRMLSRMGRGEDGSPVAVYDREEDVKSIGHSQTFDRDISDPEEARARIMGLAARVARRMRRDGYLGRTVALTVRYADFSSYCTRYTESAYTDHGPEIGRRAWEIFCRRSHPQALRLLGVAVTNLNRGGAPQPLFPEDRLRVRLNAALDRLNDRYGEDSVFWGGERESRSAYRLRSASVFIPGKVRMSVG